MKYIFTQKKREFDKTTHIRLSDGVRGNLVELADTVTVIPESRLVSVEDFEAIQSVPPPVIIPDESPTWRIKAITKLTPHGNGTLYDAIGKAIAALSEPTMTIASTVWTEGNTIERQSATVALIASACKLSSEDIDSIFIRAAELVV